jgi:hypothetical protein
MIFQSYFPRIANFFGFKPETSPKDYVINMQCRLKKNNPYNLQAGSYAKIIIEAQVGKKVNSLSTKLVQKDKWYSTDFIKKEDVKILILTPSGAEAEIYPPDYLVYMNYKIESQKEVTL